MAGLTLASLLQELEKKQKDVRALSLSSPSQIQQLFDDFKKCGPTISGDIMLAEVKIPGLWMVSPGTEKALIFIPQETAARMVHESMPYTGAVYCFRGIILFHIPQLKCIGLEHRSALSSQGAKAFSCDIPHTFYHIAQRAHERISTDGEVECTAAGQLLPQLKIKNISADGFAVITKDPHTYEDIDSIVIKHIYLRDLAPKDAPEGLACKVIHITATPYREYTGQIGFQFLDKPSQGYRDAIEKLLYPHLVMHNEYSWEPVYELLETAGLFDYGDQDMRPYWNATKTTQRLLSEAHIPAVSNVMLTRDNKVIGYHSSVRINASTVMWSHHATVKEYALKSVPKIIELIHKNSMCPNVFDISEHPVNAILSFISTQHSPYASFFKSFIEMTNHNAFYSAWYPLRHCMLLPRPTALTEISFTRISHQNFLTALNNSYLYLLLKAFDIAADPDLSHFQQLLGLHQFLCARTYYEITKENRIIAYAVKHSTNQRVSLYNLTNMVMIIPMQEYTISDYDIQSLSIDIWRSQDSNEEPDETDFNLLLLSWEDNAWEIESSKQKGSPDQRHAIKSWMPELGLWIIDRVCLNAFREYASRFFA